MSLYKILNDMSNKYRCLKCNSEFKDVYKSKLKNKVVYLLYCRACNLTYQHIPITNGIKLIYKGRL